MGPYNYYKDISNFYYLAIDSTLQSEQGRWFEVISILRNNESAFHNQFIYMAGARTGTAMGIESTSLIHFQIFNSQKYSICNTFTFTHQK